LIAYAKPPIITANRCGTMLVETIDKLENEVFQHQFELSPRAAVSLGLHDYDGKLPDLSRERITTWASKAKNLLNQINAVDKPLLDPERRLDSVYLANMIERTLFDIEQLHSHSTRPNTYTLQLSAVPYVSRDYAPIEKRINALNHHLSQIPRLLEQAKQNLDKTLPKPILDVSIIQANGVIRDLEGQASIEAAKASSATQNEFKKAKKTAEEAIRSFVEDLKHRGSTSQFAIGRDKFQQVLWMNDKLKQPLEELLQLALDDLESNLERLSETNDKLGPSRKIEQTLDAIQSNHPKPENLVNETGKMLEELRQFLIQKDIVSLPSKMNCRVIPTPALMRATTTAAMNSPGPFEKEDLEGIYYVTPVEENWDEKKKEEWLEHLNYTTLNDISIHEVYPGHYTHRLFLNKYAKTMTKKCYWNTAFGEGWAHYAEEMMLDQGYGDLKLRFMQLKEALLRDCRFIVAFKMHTQGMSVEEAKQFIMENAYMTEQPAGREALRGTFDHSYYGYTLGKLFIKRARKRFFEAHPSAPIRSFHDKLLGLGSAPVGLIEDLVVA
jgi:uncharacterized protein (DUF885 family)